MSEIIVGKTYRIREWDDIMAKCTTALPGHLYTDQTNNGEDGYAGFTTKMRHLCGRLFTVKILDTEIRRVISEEGIEGLWIICPWMLEEVEETITQPDMDLFGFLFNDGKEM